MSKLRAFTKVVNKTAKQYGFEINGDVAVDVITGLAEMYDKHGLPLCPCRFYSDIEEEKRTRDNVCPCKEFRETEHCHCNLFVKE